MTKYGNKTEAQWAATAANARRALDAFEDARRQEACDAILGKCFRFRNNYSCPTKESDYWWLYVKVVSASDGGVLTLEFQRDSEGRLSVERRHMMASMISNRYEEISTEAFALAWARFTADVMSHSSDVVGDQ